MSHTFFSPVARGLEAALAEELRELGIKRVRMQAAGCGFEGELRDAYKVCLWSRIASRVLMPLSRFAAPNEDALYDGTQTIDWDEHLAPNGTLAIDFTTVRSKIQHSQYGAQKVKDAIVDQIREKHGERPNVDRERPNVRINCFLSNDKATLSIDLAGEALHRRGYRVEQREAPLKENLAAGLLRLAGWQTLCREDYVLLDPMCGSGTLLIEAALIAANRAPGLMRDYFGFLGWRRHQPEIWKELLDDAQQIAAQPSTVPKIIGYDIDPAAMRVANANIESAGLRGVIHVERRDLAELAAPAEHGLLISNPPYGERLGEETQLVFLYTQFGESLRRHFQGWQAAIISGNPVLTKRFRIHEKQSCHLYNGALPCELKIYSIKPPEEPTQPTEASAPVTAEPAAPLPLSEGARMFANRLEKNLRHLKRWASRENITCYRVYDADMPEYSAAIDLYGDRAHVQEYAPPKTIDADKAAERMHDIISALPSVLKIPASHVHVKVRQRQKGKQQYERQADRGEFIEVTENGAKLWVNLVDYLDTGLFLDHRPTRALIKEMAKGKRFLNLFCYTGTASVFAAMGGAIESTSVDMSNTYLDWAEQNLALNDFSALKHQLIHADCIEWLENQTATYDLIFLDPPTFSNSKRMEDTFDVQRDHVPLLQLTMDRLEPGGTLIFSNNFRKFVLDTEALAEYVIEDISARTLPPDYARNPKIHRCWIIRHR